MDLDLDLAALADFDLDVPLVADGLFDLGPAPPAAPAAPAGPDDAEDDGGMATPATPATRTASSPGSGGGGDKAVGEEGQRESAADLRKRNAAASRKSRRKRRAEVDGLREKNSALEEEQDLFLRRIAELELEVEALRYTGRVDLQRENELLRDQIRKHKNFMRDIFEPVVRKAAALDDASSEHALVIQAGLSSCIEQIVGLAHTSTMWEEASGFRMKQGIDVILRHQRLPVGNVGACKRWNLRGESVHVPIAAKTLSERLWRHMSDHSALKEIASAHGSDGISRKMEHVTSQVDPSVLAKLKSDVEILRYTESDAENSIDVSLIATRQTRELYPQTFLTTPSARDAYPESTPVTCYISGMSSSLETFQQIKKLGKLSFGDVAVAETNVLSGHVIIDDAIDPDSCHLLMIRSSPVGVMRTMRSVAEIFADDGTILRSHLAKHEEKMSIILRECGVPFAAE